MIVSAKKAKPGTTEQARRLLAVLQAHDGVWLSRTDLADAIDKTRLNPNDIAQLNSMADAGMIQRRKTPTGGAIGYLWEYKSN